MVRLKINCIETFVNPYCRISGDRFLENSFNRQFYNFGAWHRPIFGKLIQWPGNSSRLFSEISDFRSVTPTDVLKTDPTMNKFSRNRSSLCPGNWKIEKILDEFPRNLSVSHPGKLKFRKNFWMSFPGFANKG